MKYQFCIRYNNIDPNSAASKAVLDCNAIFLKLGYADYTLTVSDNSNKFTYYPILFRELLRFFFSVKAGSIVGIQYPLLSINGVFKYFIKLARLKRISFFCVVHDLESLRTGGLNDLQIEKEIERLSHYNSIIVHNSRMQQWLKQKGLKKQMILLGLFDYLCPDYPESRTNYTGEIVFAGNLGKSTFIYELGSVNKKFSVYGPNFQHHKGQLISNITWKGEYSPEQIPLYLEGSFGLIWDGAHVGVCDEILGNYLNYNNPHKASLYLAAGLPLIAPANSAIGVFIKSTGTGILINSLYDLTTLKSEPAEYDKLKANVNLIRAKIINGEYFTRAVLLAEEHDISER